MTPRDSSDARIGFKPQRRRGIAAACLNAGLWGAGSGLASTTLMLYLARALGARGVAISWILAAPSLVGLLRLATPAWIERVGSRRRVCVTAFLASAGVLTLLPIVSLPGAMPSGRAAVIALAAAWAGFQALDAIGAVALWAWLADLIPRRVRGRVLARREAWLNCGVVVGTLLAIAVTALWDVLAPMWGAADIQRQAYVVCAFAGAVTLAIAALVLLRIPKCDGVRSKQTAARLGLSELTTPLVDRRFRRLMAFGLWFSFSNGIVQTTQSLFFVDHIRLPYAWKRSLDAGLRVAKIAVLPGVGAAIDDYGAVRVLTFSQATIAAAMLFFLPATPSAWWWVLGAYVLWTAYAGHDVALPNLMLSLSPPAKRAAYAAAWFAWTQLAFSLSVLAGGALFNWLMLNHSWLAVSGVELDGMLLLLGAGGLLKLLGIWWAARVEEPRGSTISEPSADNRLRI